jgi:aldose 1-epimerase
MFAAHQFFPMILTTHFRIPLGWLGLAALVGLAACRTPSDKQTEQQTPDSTTTTNMSLQKETFGTLPDGRTADLYTLTNAKGMTVKITNYGGIVTHLLAPDRNGKIEDIVLGYDSLAGYLKETPYFGALVGRYGNRIAKGKFTLDGKTYTLATNNGPNHLHGGLVGFDKVLWTVADTTAPNVLKLRYLSKDGEEGYPGNLSVEVTYTLTDENVLRIDYRAATDQPTVVNLTNHTYFNLTGNTRRDILDHELAIKAGRFVPVDKTLIPAGPLKPVQNTPFDFTTPHKIGERINADDEQIRFGGGYDHCWVFDQPATGTQLATVAEAYEPTSGRTLQVRTTEPAVQFYSGNFLDGTITGKGGVMYKHRYGFCLETEHYPDSPNRPDFPSVVLRPGQEYRTSTEYVFGSR